MKILLKVIMFIFGCLISLNLGGRAMAFTLKSSAFKEGETIPVQYTCDGADISPPLKWEDVPAGTKSFALICDDPDAPMGTWVHWVIYGIPSNITELEEGLPKGATLKFGAKQGTNDFRQLGYGGPCPPPGPPHRYYFRLYALDIEINLGPGASKQELLNVIKRHIISQAELMGRYKR